MTKGIYCEASEKGIDFSIIIPVFNRKAHLTTTIRSVLKQTYDSYEVIVIDDGSTDETAAYVESLGDSIIRFRQANSGVSAARNLGASVAKGKYLVFLDSDDLLFPWSLQCYSEVIARFHPSVISARTVDFEDEPPVVQSVGNQNPVVTIFRDYLSDAKNYSFVGASCIVIESGLFELSQGFSNEMSAAEDYDLLLRVGVENPYAKIEEPQTVAYRDHGGNASKDVEKLVKGSLNLLAREARGGYPGGSKRALDRIRVIGRVVRPVVLASIRRGSLNDAWHLYRKSFWIHVRALRVRFLIAAGFLLGRGIAVDATKRFSKIRIIH